jgi:hypothetical protein
MEIIYVNKWKNSNSEKREAIHSKNILTSKTRLKSYSENLKNRRATHMESRIFYFIEKGDKLDVILKFKQINF